jgi:hypothetical protein
MNQNNRALCGWIGEGYPITPIQKHVTCPRCLAILGRGKGKVHGAIFRRPSVVAVGQEQI